MQPTDSARTPNFALEPAAAALYVFEGCGRFAAPWRRRGDVSGGCSSVLPACMGIEESACIGHRGRGLFA